MQQCAQILPAYEVVEAVARKIARCDFRVTVQRYTTSSGAPWVITVCESRWSRHLVVESIAPDGSDANLAILVPEQSDHFGLDLDWNAVERRVTLQELIARSYLSVKSMLRPQA